MEGFEPPTSWVQISCSGQLSYIGVVIRLRSAKVMLFFEPANFFATFFKKNSFFLFQRTFCPFLTPVSGSRRKIECKYTTNLLITKHWTNFFSRCTAFFWFLAYFKGQIPVIIYIGMATLLKKRYNQSSDYPFRENFPLLFLVTRNQVRIFASVLSAKRQNELNFKNYNLWK